ncbi:hypothetical protein [Aquimarina sp. 2201CG14-23]|uniref:hypothetical protein n=1 Tax=Aquimarina mycalae TaxID=3040073 RepID=UPI002477E13E|nr:hypothetical protein [Aquimarina sp. 2201CG14-23]MDH7444686.1 hypothetical protein [Aquimarina sp. 2201CG14-23]
MSIETIVIVNDGAQSVTTRRTIFLEGLEIAKKEGNELQSVQSGDILLSGWMDDDTSNPISPSSSYAAFGEYNSGMIRLISSWDNYKSIHDK